MLKFFKGKDKGNLIYAPCKGRVVPLAEVPDPVFADKVLGDGFEDVAQMIVYLRDASDYPVVRALFAKRFPDTPIQFVVAAVCRPAWLIEMECIAIVANSNSSYESF